MDTVAVVAYLFLCHLLLVAYIINAFAPTTTTITTIHHHPISSTSSSYPYNKHTQLYGGIGIAKTYSWKEEQYEIELRVKVPKETTVRDIHYKPRSKSIHLAIGNKILLDGSREMRGMIDLDGTFWSLVDSEDHDDDDDGDGGRDVVITIEKMIFPPQDPFEVVEFDWNGIYPNDDDEVIERKYDVPEELDVREYAKSLGVDIDNINMTLVDKNMFSSGLNMTRNTLEELTKAGYVKEVTRQGDGSEFLMDEMVGGSSSSSSGSSGSSSGGGVGTVPFYPLGENVGREEMEEAGIQMDGGRPSSSSSFKSNPYMNKDSSWFQNMPVEEARTDEDVALDSSKIPKEKEHQEENVSGAVKEKKKMSDPIDLLTVAKLKEVLKREGLKTSGTKKELQERLKEHVKSIMNKKEWQ